MTQKSPCLQKGSAEAVATTRMVLHKHGLGREPRSLDSYYVHKVENFCFHDASNFQGAHELGEVVCFGELFVCFYTEGAFSWF